MHLEGPLNRVELENEGEAAATAQENGDATNGFHEPPKSVIVTNLASQIFDDDDVKSNFESSFLAFDESASFNYFKSFYRVRVNFSSPDFACNARDAFDLATIAGQTVRCFLTQPIVIGSGSPHLMPPKREKQFLISPPASPPVGWEPVPEGEPIINYDILSALTSLAPGEAHELHPASCDQPGIIVHICEEDEEGGNLNSPRGIRLPQTARPGAPVVSS